MPISNGFGEPTDRPLAMASFWFPEIDDLLPGPIDPTQTISFSCAQGPVASIDGTPHRFAVSSTLGDVMNFVAIAAQPCDDGATLAGGSHDLDTSMGEAPFGIGTLGLVNDRTAVSLARPRPPAG